MPRTARLASVVNEHSVNDIQRVSSKDFDAKAMKLHAESIRFCPTHTCSYADYATESYERNRTRKI